MTMKKTSHALPVILLIGILLFVLSGCSSSHSNEADHSGPKRDSTPKVLSPSAPGKKVYKNNSASIDASHISEGYIMVKYTGGKSKVKLQIAGPDQANYTYLLSKNAGYMAFPLNAGNGSYSLSILENVSGDSYAVALEQTISAKIKDRFLPFLYPNQYVWFTAKSNAVKKGQKLAENTWTDLEVVQNVYNYVVKHVAYDNAKAENVSYGYIPNVDETLKTGKGICFDYAALMTSMLRSQRIPTKLEIGYAGETYHAWISTYVDDKGWVDDIIKFDGKDWQLMDPTLAASNDKESVKKYVNDKNHYVVKFNY